MQLMQLAYASRPFGFDEGGLNGILHEARENNARNGVTGALICREDLYLQLLEGPMETVLETYRRILRDDRHANVRTLVRRSADRRLFARWSMRDDAVRSWMWTRKEVSSGAVERATPEDTLDIFARLAAEPPVPAFAGGCPIGRPPTPLR